MNKFNIFLRLKAWQLFMFFIALYFVPLSPYYLERTISVLFVFIYIGWIYSIGIFMHTLLDHPKPSAVYFKLSCLLICCSYIVLFFTGDFTIDLDNYKQYGITICFWVPISLYMFWSILYVFMFSARMLESVLNGHLVYRSDSLKAFFAFWFFPIGVWYIQPVVNRIKDQTT